MCIISLSVITQTEIGHNSSEFQFRCYFYSCKSAEFLEIFLFNCPKLWEVRSQCSASSLRTFHYSSLLVECTISNVEWHFDKTSLSELSNEKLWLSASALRRLQHLNGIDQFPIWQKKIFRNATVKTFVNNCFAKLYGFSKSFEHSFRDRKLPALRLTNIVTSQSHAQYQGGTPFFLKL